MHSPSLLLALGVAGAAWVAPDQHVFAGLEAPDHAGWNYYRHWLESLNQKLHDPPEVVEESRETAANSVRPEWAEVAAVDPSSTDAIDGEDSAAFNLTVWQLLSRSNLTTKFATLLQDHEGLKELLDKKGANVTVFAPENCAFEKVPDHAEKPRKEFIEALLELHIVPDLYAYKRMFGQQTLPTLLDGKNLSGTPEDTPQRLAVQHGWGGIHINNYNRITFQDAFLSNGIIHGVETFNFPPLPVAAIIGILPTVSEFELGLRKTGLAGIARKPHLGATVFAPSNSAWRGLGLKTNAFLFSPRGNKYLRALLQYHIVANRTLYTDTYYGPDRESLDEGSAVTTKRGYHIDLPTLLPGHMVGIDVRGSGPWIQMHVNHLSQVIFRDIIGQDGVIHVIDKVLIPPNSHRNHQDGDREAIGYHSNDYDGGEIDVEDLKPRLQPYVECGRHADRHYSKNLEL